MQDEHKKYLADILYQDALRTSRAELQEVSFFSKKKQLILGRLNNSKFNM